MTQKLCYPDTRVLIFLPSRIPCTRVGFRHPCRIPSVICRVPKKSNESDTRTRVGHRHPHPCPCNTAQKGTQTHTCTFRNTTEKQLKVLLNRDPARSEQEASTYQEDPAPSRPTTRTKKTLLNRPVLHAVGFLCADTTSVSSSKALRNSQSASAFFHSSSFRDSSKFLFA